jgi:hypothetical protein
MGASHVQIKCDLYWYMLFFNWKYIKIIYLFILNIDTLYLLKNILKNINFIIL